MPSGSREARPSRSWARRRGSGPSSSSSLTARVIGPAEFGKFTFAYALATVLGIVLDFGISIVLTRAVARDPGATAERWATASTLKLLLLGLSGPVYLAVPLLMHRPWDTTVAVWLLGLAIALQAFLENAVAVFTAVQRLEQELQMRLLEKGVLVTAGFAALWLGAGLLGVAAAFALAAAVSLVFAVGRIHRRVAPLDRWWRPAEARRLARELAPVAQAQFLGVATARLAPVALVLLTSDQAAGHFGAAFRVYDVAWVVLTSVEAAVFPVLARTPAALPRFGALTTQAFEALLLVVLPIALGLGVGASWLTPRIYGARVRSDRAGPGRPGHRRRVLDAGASARRRAAGARPAPPAARDRDAGVRDGAGGHPGPRGGGRGPGRGRGGAGRGRGDPGRESRRRPAPRRLAARARRGQGPGRRGGRPRRGESPAGGRGPARRRPARVCGGARRAAAHPAAGLPASPARRPRAGRPADRGGGGLMHVVLDARYIARRQSGVGAYTQRLIAGLATIDHANRYTCLAAAEGPGLPVRQANVATLPTRVSFEDHLRGDLWLLAYLPLRLRALRTDVYHGPAVFLPHVKLGYRTVVTIHDLVSFLFPETVPRKYSLYMRLMTRLAARSADRIIAVSEATKADLVEILHVPPSKIVVIHEAVGPEFARPPSPEAVDAVVQPLRAPAPLLPVRREPRAAQEPAGADRGVRGGAAAPRGRGPLGAARPRRDARLAP